MIFCSYNTHNQTILHKESLDKAVNSRSSKYENLLTIGDFNAQAINTSVKNFCGIYSFTHLLKEQTCYENAIDLVQRNLKLFCY